METNTVTTNVNRLNELRRMLAANAGGYYRAAETGRDMSNRLCRWVDEYDDLRTEPGWDAYCELNGFATTHRATDIFA